MRLVSSHQRNSWSTWILMVPPVLLGSVKLTSKKKKEPKIYETPWGQVRIDRYVYGAFSTWLMKNGCHRNSLQAKIDLNGSTLLKDQTCP